MIEAPLQIVSLGESVLIAAAGVGLTDTTTGAEVYSHPPGAAVVIRTVTESPSFNVPGSGAHVVLDIPAIGPPFTYHSMVSPTIVFPAVNVIESESHIVALGGFVVIVGLSLLSTIICNVVTPPKPLTSDGTPAAQSTPF